MHATVCTVKMYCGGIARIRSERRHRDDNCALSWSRAGAESEAQWSPGDTGELQYAYYPSDSQCLAVRNL
jgi:hypothetical protein